MGAGAARALPVQCHGNEPGHWHDRRGATVTASAAQQLAEAHWQAVTSLATQADSPAPSGPAGFKFVQAFSQQPQSITES